MANDSEEKAKEQQPNFDIETVESFGDEWSRFSQRDLSRAELEKVFNDYFRLFPWSTLGPEAEGFDMGCGSGRWAQFVAPRVKKLNCIEPSVAINQAKTALSAHNNVNFYQATADSAPIESESQDFGYCLGVLHHIPDTKRALLSCVKLLKINAPFLVYIYYSMDNRPFWYRLLWSMSDRIRRIICRLPKNLKNFVTDLIAFFIYLPLSMVARFIDVTISPRPNFPLAYYKTLSFYTMRTDARDRFGTPFERRYSKIQIEEMMLASGLADIEFSEKEPYWCAIGRRRH